VAVTEQLDSDLRPGLGLLADRWSGYA